MFKKTFAVTFPPVQLSNGEAYANKLLVNGRYPYNTMVSFSCNVGYNLDTTESGSNSSTICLDYRSLESHNSKVYPG